MLSHTCIIDLDGLCRRCGITPEELQKFCVDGKAIAFVQILESGPNIMERYG